MSFLHIKRTPSMDSNAEEYLGSCATDSVGPMQDLVGKGRIKMTGEHI